MSCASFRQRHKARVLVHTLHQPPGHSIPVRQVPTGVHFPPEFREGPSPLCRVTKHRGGYQVLVIVLPTSGDGYQMVDGGEEFPVREMGRVLLPVGVRGKLIWQARAEKAQDSRVDESLARVAVDAAIPKEDGHDPMRRGPSSAPNGRLERIALPQRVRRTPGVTKRQSRTHGLDDLCGVMHGVVPGYQ